MPTVITSKPKLVRRRMNHTTAESATMMRKPTWRGGWLETISGSRALGLMGTVWGTDADVSRSTTGSSELTSHRT